MKIVDNKFEIVGDADKPFAVAGHHARLVGTGEHVVRLTSVGSDTATP